MALRNSQGSDTVIVGNGDVHSYTEIQGKHARFGVEGVMVARGILKNPFLFRPDGTSFAPMSRSQRLQLLLNHAALFSESWNTDKYYAVIKKYFAIYANHFQYASPLRKQMLATKSIVELCRLLQTHIGEGKGNS